MSTDNRARAWLLIATVVAALPGCSDPVATTLPGVTVTALPGNSWTGVVGTALYRPIRVKVESYGVPKAGVTVAWESSDGSVAPASSLTDTSGLATTSWTLGTVPGVMTASATVAGAQGSPVTFSATALAPSPGVTVIPDPASDGQSGVVATTLSQPLGVMVLSDGAPKAGLTVTWTTTDGSLTPASSVTDAAGIATTSWTLGTRAGRKVAYAAVVGAQGPVPLGATALAGPAAAINKGSGDGQTLAANRPAFSNLVVVVTDQYGNGVPSQAITWTVVSGPVAFVTMDGATDAAGRSSAVLAPSGAQGAAVVRAALPGSIATVDFDLTVAPPEFVVYLHPDLMPAYFVSAQNGSHPPIDTIPAGQTMKWILEPFDYDLHRVVSVGQPSFQVSGDFPYAYPSTLSFTFTRPGLYRYTDLYNQFYTGMIVVR